MKQFLTATAAGLGLLIACSALAQIGPEAPQTPVNELLRPPPHDNGPIQVSVAIHVTNLTDIDEVAQRFNLVFYLFAQWRDPRLAFTPDAEHKRFHFYQPNEVWHPRLTLINEVGPRSTSDSSIRVTPDGNVLYIERSTAQLSTRFHLRRFPFDTQQLQVIVHPYVAQIHLVSLDSDQDHSGVSAEEAAYSSLAEWRLVDIRAHGGPVSIAKVGAIPEASFVIVVDRKYNYYVWKIFVPLLLIVALSWTVYWIDTRDLSSQVQISITTILTVIAFSFSISLSLPKVPYLTFIDAFFLDCLVFVFFTAIEMTTVHVSGRTKRNSIGPRIRRISRVGVPIAFVLSNVAIALYFFK